MTRCITRVSTWCSTNSGVRVSAKQPANRSVSRIARSVWPSSRAPASEVIAPPSKLATTARPATGGNSNNAGLQSVGIGASYGFEKICDRNTILSESAPQCTRFGEKSGLGAAVFLPPVVAAEPTGANVTPVLTTELPNVPGKSLTAVVVRYAPGAASPPHHHAGSVL